ncbi:hypothetical protein DYH09_07865 [bacterium CPR1]|nr:hypothetical protein [bacterium CPR1]
MIELPLPPGYHLSSTMSLHHLGGHDPAVRRGPGLWQKAVWTEEGPAAVSVEIGPDRIGCSTHGPFPGELLADILGLTDAPPPLDLPWPPVRLGRWPFVHEIVLRRILEQRVAYTDAARSHRKLVERFGQEAPLGLKVMSPRRLRRLTAGELGWAEVDPRRGRALCEVGLVWARLDRMRDPVALRRAVTSLPGCGAWTAEWTAGLALADPDAVPTGDFGLPNLVAWNLAREARADDQRMLELLEPYRGQRFRVLRMLLAAGADAPRFGPRMDPPASRLDRQELP